MRTPPVALTVAGVDSAGGAGVHADLRAFAAHRIHGATAVAALTAQSTVGIRSVQLVSADFVAAQLDAVLGDLRVVSAKTGFLGSADTIEVVIHAAAQGRLVDVVVDPVLVAASGARLFGDEVTDAYLRLFASARVVTPNRVEASVLLGRAVDTVADMEAAAVDLLETGAEVVVVKGGDAVDEGASSIDVVATGGQVRRIVMPRVDTVNDHGSGCSFAAATVCGLVHGRAPIDAIVEAKSFVHRALVGARGWRLGAGHGPIDAFGWNGHDSD